MYLTCVIQEAKELVSRDIPGLMEKFEAEMKLELMKTSVSKKSLQDRKLCLYCATIMKYVNVGITSKKTFSKCVERCENGSAKHHSNYRCEDTRVQARQDIQRPFHLS